MDNQQVSPVDTKLRRYIAQEVLNDDYGALEKADVFALGASLYELAMGNALPTGVQLHDAL